MGGEVDYRVYHHSDTYKIREEFKAACDQARYDNGNGGYTGTIAEKDGIGCFHDERLADEDSAIDYLSANNGKWENSIGVSFRLPADKIDARRVGNARYLLQKASTQSQETKIKIRKAFLARKIAFIGCSDCRSRISMNHLHGIPPRTNCPVCYSSLLSKINQERIEKAEAKVKAARELLIKTKTNGRIGWVVGGWCSS